MKFGRYGKNTRNWWDWNIQPIFLDSSDGGQLVTQAELTQVLQTTLPDNVTAIMTKTLLLRLNNTYSRWQNGIKDGEDMIDATLVVNIAMEMENYTVEASTVSFIFFFTHKFDDSKLF